MARLAAKALREWADTRERSANARRQRRRRRSYAVAGGLAATIAVIAGLSTIARDSNTNASKKAASSRAAPATTGPARTLEVDFGAVSDVRTLVARARANRGEPATAAPQPASDGIQGDGGLAPASPASQKARNPIAGVRACATEAASLSGQSAPAVRGTAKVDGRRVLVFVYRTSTDERVIVLTGTCELLTQEIGPPTTA